MPASTTITTPYASHAVVLVPPAGGKEKTAPLPTVALVINAPPPSRTLPQGRSSGINCSRAREYLGQPLIFRGMNALEALSVAAYRAFYGESAIALGGGVVAFRLDVAPQSPMVNRIVGLGVDEPATEAAVDSALEAVRGTTHYVAVSPDARPPELGRWLQTRHLEPGWGWMQFRRGVDDPPPSRTDLELVQVDRSNTADFAHVVRIAYGLPVDAERFLARVVETPWEAWVAFAGDEAAAAGALYVEGDAAYLGFAGTLPEHRGKGAQNALLAARIRRAREVGCRWVSTETGEQLPGSPSSSYRNILRAGFVEQYVVANFRGGGSRDGSPAAAAAAAT